MRLIIDGHLDLAFNALFYRRDLARPAQELREREDPWRGGVTPAAGHRDALNKPPRAEFGGVASVSLPEMRRGRVGIVLSTIMSRVQLPNESLADGMRNQLAAHAMGQAHLHYYRALEREGALAFLRTAEDLRRAAALWQEETVSPETPVGLILSMESADPILGPEDVANWWEAGLRSVGLTHFGANTWGHGTGTRGGLYACAYPLLEALAETGIALDLTHASDLTFRQILDAWDGPVHASHCMCRALVRGQRHLSDDMIRALADRGGVIGMVFAEPMLNPDIDFDDLRSAPRTARRTMAGVVDHIDHVCQLTGSCDHVAIGSDLDGGFGREWAPVDYDTIADLQKFLAILERRGYSAEEVARIAHGNLLRFFGEVMP